MRVIVHLSDLHFGRDNGELLEPLRARVEALAPHLVVVSGDLTQRARPGQFRAAKRFLDSLPKPQLVVPGNHDVPLYNVFQRFFRPFDRYRRFLGGDLDPGYFDDEIAVVGINTARSATFKYGSISERQVAKVREKLRHLPERIAKIIVTHHPFDIPENRDENQLVNYAVRAMATFAACGADIFLSGHMHTTHTSHSAKRYKIPGHSALLVHAGTATSTRSRNESNSFNALHVTPGDVSIERYTWQAEKNAFVLSSTERFLHAPDGWHPPR